MHNAPGTQENSSPISFREPGRSFRDKLLGDIPGAYEQAFDFEWDLGSKSFSDTKTQVYLEGEAEVILSGKTKTRIWS